ncbi:uncharacterized protein [Musca autumnalis]|uniref:uncharacterized protein n=1 Tax=Musca autumnalis TaxID=221902 RepID=UPI003CEBA165
MNKFLIICMVALVVLVTPGAGYIDPYEEHYTLLEEVSKELQASIWSEELYKKFGEYINGVKQWSETDENLQKSSIYNRLQEQIEKCLSLVKDLEADTTNCHKQLALKEAHNEIRSLFDSVEEKKLHSAWVKKYMDFVASMRSITKNANEQFYSYLETSVYSYMYGSDFDNRDLNQWYTKFVSKTDNVEKQQMFMEFLDILAGQREDYEAKNCEIQFSHGL